MRRLNRYEEKQELKIQIILVPFILLGWVVYFVALGISLGKGKAKKHLQWFFKDQEFLKRNRL